ncbi:MAG: hypothetical protein MZV63_48775 [Marinilabiliales bacterium]|nr:hypothetical protein [Marinilabiliales bacterium]
MSILALQHAAALFELALVHAIEEIEVLLNAAGRGKDWPMPGCVVVPF